LELRQLRYFLAAAEHQNFRRAAETVHVAQPALSRQIAALEAELGLTLFTRTKKRVHLSDAGRAFLDDARRIVRDVELAKEHARRVAAGKAGVLRVGFHEAAGRSPLVTKSFHTFRMRYPDVELRLTQMTSPKQYEALQLGRLDVGFVYEDAQQREVVRTAAMTVDRFYLALHRGHPLVSRRRILLAHLVDEPFIWLSRTTNAVYADHLLHLCLAGGLVPRIIQETEGEATMMNLVAVGMAVAFVLSSTAKAWSPGVVLKPLADLTETMQLVLAAPRESSTPLARTFAETTRAVVERKRRSV